MRLVQREIRQPRIIVVGRVVTRIWLGVFFTHSASYAQISIAQTLNAEIKGVRISADRRPVVTFKISDGQGRALELSDLDDGRIRFTIAAIKAETNGQTSYHNYILTKVAGKEYLYKGETKKPALTETLQPDFDNGGTLARLRPGVFTYTFKTALPADHDLYATHVIGGELTRDKGKFVANPLFEFVPSGGKVKTQRAVVETASCNNCHDPLKYHGGAKREAH
jgi:OmcA/MtrC family decaheme c-type cytochrome